MSAVLYAATLVTALGCGIIAGAFFAFSSFVMPALKRLPTGGGITAMQSINVLAVTPVFMTALFGTAAACLGLIAWAAFSWGEQPTALVLAGGALYIVGTIGVTIACNVPLNDRLATLRPKAQTRRAVGRSTSQSGPRGTTCGSLRPSPRQPCLLLRSMPGEHPMPDPCP